MAISETWIKHWQGNWSLLSCSFFGEQYTEKVKPFLGASVSRAVLVSKNGLSACYFPSTDLDEFGRFLGKALTADAGLTRMWSNALMARTDAVLTICKNAANKPISAALFHSFLDALYAYGAAHLGVKKVVDYLPLAFLKTHLPVLEAARKYSEPVYAQSEVFMRCVAAQVSKKTSVPADWVLCCVRNEFDDYWKNGTLPPIKTLAARFMASALYFKNGSPTIYSGKKALDLEQSVSHFSDAEVLKGQSAFGGKAVGSVRIVWDPQKAKSFRKGDILVTGMTRPPFIPLMKKAGAVVTDAGGVLCHAAIVARELKIPCVVGTQTASKTFKEGDVVEVDATLGMVRKVD